MTAPAPLYTVPIDKRPPGYGPIWSKIVFPIVFNLGILGLNSLQFLCLLFKLIPGDTGKQLYRTSIDWTKDGFGRLREFSVVGKVAGSPSAMLKCGSHCNHGPMRPDFLCHHCRLPAAGREHRSERCKRQSDWSHPSRSPHRDGQPPGVHRLDVSVDPSVLFGNSSRNNYPTEGQSEAHPFRGMGNGKPRLCRENLRQKQGRQEGLSTCTEDSSYTRLCSGSLTTAILQIHIPKAILGCRSP